MPAVLSKDECRWCKRKWTIPNPRVYARLRYPTLQRRNNDPNSHECVTCVWVVQNKHPDKSAKQMQEHVSSNADQFMAEVLETEEELRLNNGPPPKRGRAGSRTIQGENVRKFTGEKACGVWWPESMWRAYPDYHLDPILPKEKMVAYPGEEEKGVYRNSKYGNPDGTIKLTKSREAVLRDSTVAYQNDEDSDDAIGAAVWKRGENNFGNVNTTVDAEKGTQITVSSSSSGDPLFNNIWDDALTNEPQQKRRSIGGGGGGGGSGGRRSGGGSGATGGGPTAKLVREIQTSEQRMLTMRQMVQTLQNVDTFKCVTVKFAENVLAALVLRTAEALVTIYMSDYDAITNPQSQGITCLEDIRTAVAQGKIAVVVVKCVQATSPADLNHNGFVLYSAYKEMLALTPPVDLGQHIVVLAVARECVTLFDAEEFSGYFLLLGGTRSEKLPTDAVGIFLLEESSRAREQQCLIFKHLGELCSKPDKLDSITKFAASLRESKVEIICPDARKELEDLSKMSIDEELEGAQVTELRELVHTYTNDRSKIINKMLVNLESGKKVVDKVNMEIGVRAQDARVEIEVKDALERYTLLRSKDVTVEKLIVLGKVVFDSQLFGSLYTVVVSIKSEGSPTLLRRNAEHLTNMETMLATLRKNVLLAQIKIHQEHSEVHIGLLVEMLAITQPSGDELTNREKRLDDIVGKLKQSATVVLKSDRIGIHLVCEKDSQEVTDFDAVCDALVLLSNALAANAKTLADGNFVLSKAGADFAKGMAVSEKVEWLKAPLMRIRGFVLAQVSRQAVLVTTPLLIFLKLIQAMPNNILDNWWTIEEGPNNNRNKFFLAVDRGDYESGLSESELGNLNEFITHMSTDWVEVFKGCTFECKYSESTTLALPPALLVCLASMYQTVKAAAHVMHMVTDFQEIIDKQDDILANAINDMKLHYQKVTDMWGDNEFFLQAEALATFCEDGRRQRTGEVVVWLETSTRKMFADLDELKNDKILENEFDELSKQDINKSARRLGELCRSEPFKTLYNMNADLLLKITSLERPDVAKIAEVAGADFSARLSTLIDEAKKKNASIKRTIGKYTCVYGLVRPLRVNESRMDLVQDCLDLRYEGLPDYINNALLKICPKGAKDKKEEEEKGKAQKADATPNGKAPAPVAGSPSASSTPSTVASKAVAAKKQTIARGKKQAS